MIRRPPRSTRTDTLFPYTTLFRSERDAVVVTAQGREEDILAVPYNSSVVSGEAIEQRNILDTAELMRGVAGVAVVDRGARNSSVVSGIRIRGLNVDSSALGDYAVSAT